MRRPAARRARERVGGQAAIQPDPNPPLDAQRYAKLQKPSWTPPVRWDGGGRPPFGPAALGFGMGGRNAASWDALPSPSHPRMCYATKELKEPRQATRSPPLTRLGAPSLRSCRCILHADSHSAPSLTAVKTPIPAEQGLPHRVVGVLRGNG